MEFTLVNLDKLVWFQIAFNEPIWSWTKTTHKINTKQVVLLKIDLASSPELWEVGIPTCSSTISNPGIISNEITDELGEDHISRAKQT